ncbi:hypothetical protein [Prescottella equi]|uniref:hypothetical protein n=1 Tax=Rhodococcus hoagii TaxID=43767 RepID=UPI000A0F9B82|nr:hypothetical protein [Prescottella equi]ORL15425.1 hypothetical protein A6I85_05990 [Prescottella equi]
MVTSYGFKLYELTVVRRDGRTPQPWKYKLGDDKTEHQSLDDIERVLVEHKSTPEWGFPLGPDARPLTESEMKQRPVFRVESVERVGDHCLLVGLRYGRHKDEDKGLPATDGVSEEIDLTDIAPTRIYRVALFAPTTGEKGMMAFEQISNACPSKYFMKWLRRWIMDSATDPDGYTNPDWRKLVAKPAMDPSLLKKYIEKANADTVVLVQQAVKGSRQRSSERFRIQAAVFGNQSAAVTQLVGQAIVGDMEEDGSDAQYAKELASVLGTDLAGLEFDDGWVVMDTESGPQHISPSRVPEIFFYPIGNERPSEFRFRERTKVEILRIRRSVGATLAMDEW